MQLVKFAIVSFVAGCEAGTGGEAPARSRFLLGSRVRISGTEQEGDVVDVDGSATPFKVAFEDGGMEWFKERHVDFSHSMLYSKLAEESNRWHEESLSRTDSARDKVILDVGVLLESASRAEAGSNSKMLRELEGARLESHLIALGLLLVLASFVVPRDICSRRLATVADKVPAWIPMLDDHGASAKSLSQKLKDAQAARGEVDRLTDEFCQALVDVDSLTLELNQAREVARTERAIMQEQFDTANRLAGSQLAEAQRQVRLLSTPPADSATFLGLGGIGLVRDELEWCAAPNLAGAVMASVRPGMRTYDAIAAAFDNSGQNPDFVVREIKAIQNRTLEEAFNARFNILRPRRANNATPFHQRWPAGTPKSQALVRLQQAFLSPDPGRNANVLFSWHGATPEAVAAISSTGFAALQKLDGGYWCQGMYTTTSPEYACLYGAGDLADPPLPQASGCVLLCLNVVGLAYAVDRDMDYPPGAGPDASCSLMGTPLKTSEGFDAHVAVVDPDIGFQAAANPATGRYVEIVVQQEAQILPVAVVHFDRN